MIKDSLIELGLNNKEAELYLAILQNGKIDVPEASRLTGINRTTIYSVSAKLVKKGFITQDLGSKPNILIAVPPENLRNFVVRQKNLVENLIPELHSLSKDTEYSIPKIKFVPEVDLDSYLYERTVEWDNSMKDTDSTWWGCQDPSFAPTYKKWINWYWNRPESKEIKVKIITNSKEDGLLPKYERRNVMLWDESIKFTAATWVVGNYIVMIMHTQKPQYLIEIYDKAMAHNLRELFKGVWLKEKKS